MNYYPTTTITLLRGTTDDAYGDPYDNETPAASGAWAGIPASIIEQVQDTRRPDSDRPMTIRTYDCRLPSEVDVRDGDRVQDESDDQIYILDTIAKTANPAREMDWRLVIKKVS